MRQRGDGSFFMKEEKGDVKGDLDRDAKMRKI